MPHLVACHQCRSPRLPHHACPVCGTYRGRTVFRVEEERHRPT
jgi:large subunit ribosomal protein L32